MARAGGLLTAAVGISAVVSHFGGSPAALPLTSDKSVASLLAGGPVAENSMDEAATSFLLLRPNGPMRTLIATVPDPEKTQLKLQFDRAVESIERAAVKSGYILRYHWLPWEASDHRESDDPKKREETEIRHRTRLNQPGLLLFDHEDDGDERQLAIFLVGESPISGVDQVQLKTALGYELHTQFEGFLGPQFSGSWTGLQEFAKDHEHISFYTTTTSLKRQDHFAKLFKKRIFTTLHTADAALNELRSHVEEVWGVKSKPALVAEDETSYSESLTNDQNERSKPYFKFKYPRELSHLRNAARNLGTPADPKLKDLATGPLVALTLRDDSRNADIPDFSKDQTPVSQESMLLQIAEEINRKHLEFSGVLATDILDALFVNRFLHSTCSNTRLFVTEPDILLAHGTDSSDFQGMLVVSGFPLLSKLNEWGKKNTTESILFPSAESAGIYNNLVWMLTKDFEKGAYYGDPTKTFSSFVPQHPPLWLTVLGRNGFWPVDILKTDRDENPYLGDAPAATGLLSVDSPNRLWWVCFGLITMSCFSIAFLDRAILSNGDRRWTLFALKTGEIGLPARAFWLSMLSLLMAVLEGLWTVMPLRIWTAQSVHDSLAWRVEFLPVFFGVTATAAVLVTSIRCALKIGKGKNPSKPREERAQAGFYQTTAAAAFFAFAGIVVLGYLFVTSYDLAPTFFLAYRSLNLSSGVCPIVPATFIMIGFCSYAYLNLERVNFHVDRRPFVPELKDDLYCEDLHGLVAKICRRIYKPYFHGGDFGVGLVFAALGALYIRFHAHQSVEPTQYENLFIAAVSISVALMAINCNRLFAVWVPFHEFLRNLERHPLRRGFGQLPKHFVWSPTWQGGSTQRTHVLISRSVDCLQSILASADSPISLRIGLKSHYNGMIDDAKAVISASQQQKRVSSDIYRRLQKKLAHAGEAIAQDFRADLWSKGEYEIRSDSDGDAARKATEKHHAAEQYLVYRYLAFINYVLIQQQNFVASMTAMFLLLALALYSYPFLSQSMITGLLTATFAVLVVSVASIFSRLDRDPILSRATGTEGGQLDRYFFLKFVSYISLPLLTVLGSYFPSIGRFLFSWLLPAAEALH